MQEDRVNYDSKIELFTDWIRRHESNEVRRFVDAEKDSLILPIPTAVILEFFGHIGNGGYIDVDSDGEVEVAESVTNEDSIKYKAVYTIDGYRSAITALYKEHHISHILPRDELSEFLSGYKRTIADLKAEGNMSQHEGKRPVTLEEFRKLATFSFQSGYDVSQYLTNTLFILLCWNLMSRSISVARLMYNHITWIGDALVVELPKH